MKNAKYLTFIPLGFWIILWIALIGTVVYFTNLKFLYVLMFIPLFSLFNLIWWVLVMNEKRALDRLTSFSFLIVLNFPAYWLAKKSREYAIKEEIRKTGNAKNLIHPELDSEYDLLPNWEKEIIKNKEPNKLQKMSEYLIDPKFELQRLILNSYNQFLLYQVWTNNPGITQTYDLNQLIKKNVCNQTTNQKFIQDFTKNYEQWLIVDWKEYPDLKDNQNYIEAVLTETSPEEILVSYKQNRVDNTIEVKRILMVKNKKKSIE